jgi:hypothetical protein
MVYCELGRLPLYVERQCKMVKYWTKLLNTENCILKGCYDDMFEYSCSNNIKWYSSFIEFLLQLKQNLSFLLMLLNLPVSMFRLCAQILYLHINGLYI